MNGSLVPDMVHGLKGLFPPIFECHRQQLSWYPDVQHRLNKREVYLWNWWIETCKTLAMYNQSSLKRPFQPHKPCVVFWGSWGRSLKCVLLGYIFLFVMTLSMEKDRSAWEGRRVLSEEQQNLRAVADVARVLLNSLGGFYFHRFKRATDNWWQVGRHLIKTLRIPVNSVARMSPTNKITRKPSSAASLKSSSLCMLSSWNLLLGAEFLWFHQENY